MNDRAVMFDLDGTLTDPKPGITRCIQHALRALGCVPPSEDDLEWCIGPPLQESFARLLPSPDDILVTQAIAHYRERFSTIGLFENAVYAGVSEALTTLRSRGYRTYVATSKPRVFALRILEHFGIAALFDSIHGSELDGTRSNKGDLIAHLLATEGLDAAQVLMVGDREHDVIGGTKNGVRCIGVTYGYGTASELTKHGAARLASDPQQVVVAVEALFA